MKIKLSGVFALLLPLAPITANAHTGIGAVHGWLDGLAHPFIGIDHLLVMLAVGLWAAMRGGKALWLLPLAFLTAMAAGASLSFSGIAFGAVETWVAVSVVAAGILVWHNTHMPSGLAVVLVALFAILHGYAHAAELQAGADAFAYAAGFLLSTALLHGFGLAMGLLAVTRLKIVSTSFGALCTLVGMGLLAGM